MGGGALKKALVSGTLGLSLVLSLAAQVPDGIVHSVQGGREKVKHGSMFA